MDRAAFFDAIRPMFGGSMSQSQVDGCETLLSIIHGMHVTCQAYLLATAFHETARTMQPITEYGSPRYFDKYDAGTRIGARLGNDQHGDGFRFRGRGYVQLTGRRNYALASRKLGVDLIADPDKALHPAVAGRILRLGMSEGWFTGAALHDYLPGDYVNARRIVNGTDRAKQIARYAETCEAALREARGVALDSDDAPTAPPAREIPTPGLLAALIAAVAGLFAFLRK